jgi:hypothetical protein
MSSDIKLHKLAKEKQVSRDIVREVLTFGINENQKLDVLHGIALSLENNKALKDIVEVLKNYREVINKDENTDNNINDNDKPKIILE